MRNLQKSGVIVSIWRNTKLYFEASRLTDYWTKKNEQEIIYILLALTGMEGRYRGKCKLFVEEYLGPCQTSLMEILMKIGNSYKLFTFFTKKTPSLTYGSVLNTPPCKCKYIWAWEKI